ncbi:TPA: hypothetical protein QDB04_001393 [Burkholderia vietnamiensis]|nr:hypothetical protein [Burkholderia vietnamiensis]
MKVRQSKFTNLPPVATNVITLGSLIFNHPKLQGPGAVLDLTKYKHCAFARDLIASLYKRVEVAKISAKGSLGAYFACARDIMKYIGIEKFPESFRMVDIDPDFLRDFKIYLVDSTLHRKSERRRRRYGDLIRLLDAGKKLQLWSSGFTPPRNFGCVDDGDKTQPYMASELIDIEKLCRDQINELCLRIDRGQELLTQGVDPRGRQLPHTYINGRRVPVHVNLRPWNQLPNLLWYVKNVLGGRYLTHNELANGHSSFITAGNGGPNGEKTYTKAVIYGYFYPLNVDMLPFLNLLEKKLGINESSLVELKRKCLVPLELGYRLDYQKGRSKKKQLELTLNDDGPNSAVAIIKTLLRLTEPLVEFANPSDKNRLFLCLTPGPNKTNPVKPIDACYAKSMMNRTRGWTERHGLKDQHGKKLRMSARSLRVSKLSANYRKDGNYKKAMRQAAHTFTETTVKHYLDNDSTKIIHDLAVTDGINALRAVSRPKVLTTDDVEVATKVLDLPKTKARQILNGKQDVFIAACRDFLNKPGGEPDTPCDEPWGCLVCGNAVVTRHILPRLIAFRDFLIAEQQKDVEAFIVKFGDALNIICLEILPAFQASVIKEAERYAANGDFYVPIHFKSM